MKPHIPLATPIMVDNEATTWGAFLDANEALTLDEVTSLEEDLLESGEATYGGGAAGLFVISLLKDPK